MTRKDTILIAVVINAGLLAILFTTAIIYDIDQGIEITDYASNTAEQKPAIVETSPYLLAYKSTEGDEVDRVLNSYSQQLSQHALTSNLETPAPETLVTSTFSNEQLNAHFTVEGNKSIIQPYIEVSVKKGDVLEKIAKTNGTSVAEIKEMNKLQTERLSIGQVLKIPNSNKKHAVATSIDQNGKSSKTSNAEKPPRENKEQEDAVYYVIKSGDNPWKVARQFNVKFDDILRLNQLDEDKARNLKIGDRIRVK